MSGAPLQTDTRHLERALDRLAEHCELATRRARTLEERRIVVRARLEEELGQEFASVLLHGLVRTF